MKAESTQEYLLRFDAEIRNMIMSNDVSIHNISFDVEIRKMIMSNDVSIYNSKITGLMGDYVSSNIEEIIDWIKLNCKGGARYEGLAMLYTLKFDREEDITLFSLRWL